jgi:hypothetical protein
MGLGVSGTITGTFNAQDVRVVGLNTNANLPINNTTSTGFVTGTGALGTQVLWQSPPRTLSGTTDILNLFSGVPLDSYGTPVVLTSVKAGQIVNTGTSLITLGAASSNPWNTFLGATSTLILPPGAWIMFATPDVTGWAVGTSTNVNLLVTGTSGQTYTIALLGTGT